MSLRFIIYCARRSIVITPKIEVESSFLAVRKIEGILPSVLTTLELSKCCELFDPPLVKFTLLSAALWKNRSSAQLLKQRERSRKPIGFCCLMIEPPLPTVRRTAHSLRIHRVTLVKKSEHDENLS